jgi:hypothetical protein
MAEERHGRGMGTACYVLIGLYLAPLSGRYNRSDSVLSLYNGGQETNIAVWLFYRWVGRSRRFGRT